MQTQVKWLMGIIAALIVSGATGWAASIESRFANIDEKMESLLRLEILMLQVQNDIKDIKLDLKGRYESK